METTPIIEIQKAKTMDELVIHIGYISEALKEIKATEKQHHADNIARNDIIVKKLDDMQASYATRQEFVEYQKQIEEEKKEILNDAEKIHLQIKERSDKTDVRVENVEEKISDLKIIRNLVYGCVAIMLTMLITGIVYLVVNHTTS